MTNTHAFTNPSDEHICALLSKLAYEDLTPNFDFNNLDKTQYTASEILYLKENFSVESVKNDTDTGFFGCFLKNKNNNNIYYTINHYSKHFICPLFSGLCVPSISKIYFFA